MNYRHAYHAGGFTDVFKHVILMLLLEHLLRKETPVFLLDTHAGTGQTDLTAAKAQRTGESAGGIGRLWDADLGADVLARYRSLVAGFNHGDGLTVYPGSPQVMRTYLRVGDRLVVNELHPEDSALLANTMGADRRVRVTEEDGYGLLKALLPPPERRGLVLVDPPFEVRDEFALMTRALKDAHRRWATGIYAFWYPNKDPATIAAWHGDLRALGIPRITAFDLLRWPVANPERLNGCGVTVVNPPWTLAGDLQTATPALVDLLTEGRGHMNITIVAGEPKR